MRSIFFLSLVILIGWDSANAQVDTSFFDPLFLEEVVITDYSEVDKLRNPISLSTIESPADRNIQGIASTLSQVPGIFTDGSTGEAFSRVYTRGISLSAEDDIGWYYMSLQEDGMPVTAVHFNQYSPDFFVRPDVSVQRIEVIRGGKSSILANASPGGIINLISESTPDTYQTHDRLTLGMYHGGRPYLRVEGFSGASIGSSSWAYDFGYMYRHDQGPRDLDYALNNGGQVKLGIQKKLSDGILSFKFKWLNDKVNRYTGIAATNWNKPIAAFGQDFRTTSLLPPTIEGRLPDPQASNQNGSDGLRTYDPSNGIRAGELSALVNLDVTLGEWRLSNKLKYSAKSLDWQTAIGGQPIGLENFISYFISGDNFPIGAVTFSDAQSGQSLATVNNEGAFAVFQGLPPSFEYLNGTLPNDAILGTGTWLKDDQVNEWMNQLLLRREFDQVNVNIGMFYARSTVDMATSASFLYATYENNPRPLSVSLDFPDFPTRFISDENGLSNFGGLFYEGAEITARQFNIFTDIDFIISDRFGINAGVRYETIGHSGTKDRFAPMQLPEGGLDGNPLTTYDNAPLGPAGNDPIDANYNYVSFSFAPEYALSSSLSLFGRYSQGYKPPELNYYINNFSNQPIPDDLPPVQSIQQTEAGIKFRSQKFSGAFTGFVSRLDDIAYSNFVFDDQENQIFYTPTQFNASQTVGIELEMALSLSPSLAISGNAVLQNPKMKQFTRYNANETIEPEDDVIVDFSDNRLPHNPSLMANLSMMYVKEKWNGSIDLHHMGKRYGNLENAFELPSYQTVDLKINYKLNEKFTLGFQVDNALNSEGLINFFGPNTFGNNSDGASAEFINTNPNASFVVFPIMPRVFYISLDYNFKNN